MSLAPPTGRPVDHAPSPARDPLVSRVPYLPGLDGMRAIAVIAVMIYHANSTWLSGGFLGVEMFFVISGYLITLLLISERERDDGVSLRQFWMRRARRLLPALYVMMAVVIVWTALFEPDALGLLRGDVIAGLFYVSNWYQIWVGLGYTAAADFAPLRHLWSLAVEEQFYLLWPLVMVVLLRRYGTRRIFVASRWLFLAAILVTVLGAIVVPSGAIGDPSTTPDAYWWIGDRAISKLDTLYLGTISRSSGLLMGAALAMVWRPHAVSRGPVRRLGRGFDAAALVALVVFAWLSWNLHLLRPDGSADPWLFQGGMFMASFATLVVIAAVAHSGSMANRMLGNRLLVWIGVRSYGMYLYHWPIYQFMRKAAGNKLNLAEFAAAMVLTVVVTELSYRFIETPIRKGRLRTLFHRARVGRPKRARGAIVGGTAVVCAASLLLGATLATAGLQQNEVSQDLAESERFVTDLTKESSPSGTSAPVPGTSAPPTSAPSSPTTTVSAGKAKSPTTVPAATEAPPTTKTKNAKTQDAKKAKDAKRAKDAKKAEPKKTVPDPEPAQLGVVTDLSDFTPLEVPKTDGGIPLIALGDSVMLGAAEELQAAGFAVDALKSRQMISFLPDLELMRDNRTFGGAVVVHLGTNGAFSQGTLDQMLNYLKDVPIVVLLTGKAQRGWIAGNNARLRVLPETHPNVTVLDWEALSQHCEGRCFYDDGIHLPPDGQRYYTNLITQVLDLS